MWGASPQASTAEGAAGSAPPAFVSAPGAHLFATTPAYGATPNAGAALPPSGFAPGPVDPAPAAPAERPKRRGRLAWTLGAVAALIAFAVVMALTWPYPIPLAKAAEYWGDDSHGQSTMPAATDEQAEYWSGINDAMLKKDRERFLSYATGTAVDQLALWWDNTTAIGWDVAAITPWDDTTVLLGAQLAFAAHPERGSGANDSGLELIQGYYYTVTWTDDKISSIVPYDRPAPWDEGPIYVARAAHVVLIGMEDERALVDANLAVVEQGGADALGLIARYVKDLPLDGFVAAVTGSADRMHRWQWGDNPAGWDMEIAGVAMATSRPHQPEPWLDPRIATGDNASGTFLVLGPLSADQRLETATHEFLHAVHRTGAPEEKDSAFAVPEGFAEWGTMETGASKRYYTYPEVRQAIASQGAGAMSDTALRSKDAWIAYAAAASFYAFVAANGGNPWELASDGRTEGTDLPTAAAKQNPAFTVAAWQAWVASQ